MAARPRPQRTGSATTRPRPTGAPTGQPRIPLGSAPAGRPPSNLGQYLLKPTDASNTGYELLNTKPAAIAEAHEKYLKQFQLPPALQPKYLRRPEVMEVGRQKAISKGWRAPRSRAR